MSSDDRYPGSSLTEEQLARLPKWAAAEVRRLACALVDARSRLAAGSGDSDTFAGPYDGVPRPLGRGTTIRYGSEDIYFDVSYAGGELAVRTSGRKSGRLAVLPEVSNSVRIQAQDL